MPTIIQILLICFFVYAAARVFFRYRADQISLGVSISWITFWIAAAFVVAVPDITYFFARKAGIGRGADLVTYVALALVFYMIFRLSVTSHRINKDITKISRKIALDEHFPTDESKDRLEILKMK